MKTWQWVLIIVAIVFIGGGSVFYFFFWPQIETQFAPSSNASPTVSVSPGSSVKNTISGVGVTWLAPKKLDDLKLTIRPAGSSGIDTTSTYYKIADLKDGGEIILDIYQPDCPCQPELLRFKKDTAGKYSYLVNNSADKDASSYGLILSKDVTIDSTTILKSISAPDTFVINGTTLKSAGGEGIFSEDGATLIGSSSFGKVYQAQIGSTKDEKVGGIVFKLVLPDSTYASYTMKLPFMTDNGVAQVTWKDGTKNTEHFTAEGYVGCGSVGSNNVVLDASKIDTRLTETGTTETGDKIYKAAATDAILEKAYENYKTGRVTADTITIEQFAAKNTVFVWKAPIGTYVIFTNSAYGGLAECGKPVIYLYPTKAMDVKVQVGANITKSEPTYNNGWNAYAEPSGKLTVNGQTYDSLFWEGTGQEYPTINSGTVVRSVDAVAIIKTQLAQMGLTEKEIADFVEFWAPKMPTTPYTRLTWFGTSDMNKLAPLTITPAPDTLIRVFLDFEGLNSPINLAPQKLNPFVRRGFTVVEWGGLLK